MSLLRNYKFSFLRTLICIELLFIKIVVKIHFRDPFCNSIWVCTVKCMRMQMCRVHSFLLMLQKLLSFRRFANIKGLFWLLFCFAASSFVFGFEAPHALLQFAFPSSFELLICIDPPPPSVTRPICAAAFTCCFSLNCRLLPRSIAHTLAVGRQAGHS